MSEGYEMFGVRNSSKNLGLMGVWNEKSDPHLYVGDGVLGPQGRSVCFLFLILLEH
jgi:hypothetical protein